MRMPFSLPQSQEQTSDGSKSERLSQKVDGRHSERQRSELIVVFKELLKNDKDLSEAIRREVTRTLVLCAGRSQEAAGDQDLNGTLVDHKDRQDNLAIAAARSVSSDSFCNFRGHAVILRPIQTCCG
jgi:hypothetical protein